MCLGVSKSGSPISRWTISRPARSSCLARASTSKADSVPSRAIRGATFMSVSFVDRLLYGVDFARVPAGEFRMGWSQGHPCERPVHAVWIDAFLIARTPATNGDFTTYLAATGAPAP